MGFQIGHELTWMPEALRILRDELPNIDVMISSQYSPQLADAIVKGTSMQLFFDANKACQSWRSVLSSRSPWWWSCLVTTVWLRKAISPGDLVGETFVGVSHTAPVLRAVIDDYLKRSGINITPDHEADNVVMGVSLIASTGGVGLLPAYARTFSLVCNESSSQGRHADCRAGPRLQKVERVSHPKAFAFEIGRVGRSCLEEGALRCTAQSGVPQLAFRSLVRITIKPEVMPVPRQNSDRL
jgi:DNA-binding transcriptional LysR family regulator